MSSEKETPEVEQEKRESSKSEDKKTIPPLVPKKPIIITGGATAPIGDEIEIPAPLVIRSPLMDLRDLRANESTRWEVLPLTAGQISRVVIKHRNPANNAIEIIYDTAAMGSTPPSGIDTEIKIEFSVG